MTMGITGTGGMSADALDALGVAEGRGGLDELRDIVAEERRRGRIASEIEQLLADYAAGVLDEDAVLFMCQRRLEGLDAQIKTIMGDLENANTRATEIGA